MLQAWVEIFQSLESCSSVTLSSLVFCFVLFVCLVCARGIRVFRKRTARDGVISGHCGGQLTFRSRECLQTGPGVLAERSGSSQVWNYK